MRYRFVADRRERWPVRALCAALGVRASGDYAWRGRPPGAWQGRRAALRAAVRAAHARAKARYGRPRVHAELRAQGHGCTVRTVAELVRAAGTAARTRRKFRATTDSDHGRPVAANLLDRRFAAAKPDAVWVADITDVPPREGWLSLAVVADLHARRVVGWSMDATMTSRLVVDALAMAVRRRRRRPGADLLAHSDRGGQYASEHDQRLLGEHGIACSMSRRGNCWDNAPAESSFATLKKELTRHEDDATREAARASVFECIAVFYNRERRHSALGDQSPAEFEAATAG